MTNEAVLREPVKPPPTVAIAGEEIALTPFCVYKFQQACDLLAQMLEKLGLKELLQAMAGLPDEATPVQQIYFLAPILPLLLRELPDAVREFVALCMIPNQRLAELYDQEGGIAAETERISKKLLFEARPAELLEAFAAFLSCLEVNELKNALGKAAEGLDRLMNPPQEQKRRRRRG